MSVSAYVLKPESSCCYANHASRLSQYPILIAADNDQLDFRAYQLQFRQHPVDLKASYKR